MARTGEECPGGTVAFQSTFFSGRNSTGKSLASETPDPLGPRKRGQSAEITEALLTAIRSRQMLRERIVNSVIQGLRYSAPFKT